MIIKFEVMNTDACALTEKRSAKIQGLSRSTSVVKGEGRGGFTGP